MVVITRDRYVVFKVVSDDFIPSLSILKSAIWYEYENIFGINGTSGAGLFFDDYKEGGKGIIRCVHKALSNLMIVLSRITTVNNKHVILIPLYTTGLINKAKKYLNLPEN